MNRLKYNAGTGNQKNWLIQETVFDERYLGKCEAIFAQGNGYLGVRNALEETYTGEVRDTFITGTFNKASSEEVTELPNIPDMTGINIKINGQELNLLKGKLERYCRTMNLKNGEVVREIIWETPSKIRLQAQFRRIVSLENEHLMATAVEFFLDQDADLVIETGIDGSVTNSGAQHFCNIERRVYDINEMQYVSQTTESQIWIAQHAACRLNVKADVLPEMGRRTLKNKYHFRAKKDQKISFEKVSVYHSSRDMGYMGKQNEQIIEKMKQDGRDVLKTAFSKGYEGIKRESEKQWEKYWKASDIIIEGNADFDQLAIRFALYHLNIMVKHEDNRVGIGAKALTGEGYKGHSFWDTEMFILPYFIFTKPETARTLLEYRYKNLYGARKKAQKNGYEGAMYPWECAWVSDGEVTPEYAGTDVITGECTKCWTGLIEHHITADIAYAVEQYYLVTNDQDYMEQYGCEIILETARFWASRLQYVEEQDRYEILDVIGPDEYKEHVDNNAYTNYMAKHNMELALHMIQELEAKHVELYGKLDQKINLLKLKKTLEERIEKLYIPKPDTDGIISQADGFKNLKELNLTKYKLAEQVGTIFDDFNIQQISQYKVIKQADIIMLFFVLGVLFDKEIQRKNFEYYEEKTLHDSSLSKCIHAIIANDLGMEEIAYEFYESCLNVDLGLYMKSSDAGIHSASIGGIWESTVMGFGGVRMKGEKLYLTPKLPQKWTKLTFPLCIKGNFLKISVDKTSVTVINHGNEEVSFLLQEEMVKVPAGMKMERKIRENEYEISRHYF